MNFITEITASSLGYLAVQFITNFQNVLLWTVSPFVVEVLLKYLKKLTRKKNEDLVQKCKKCLEIFESLTLSFSNFFVLYFTLIQCFSIFITFILIRTFPVIVTFTLQGILLFIGYVTGLAFNIIWLITMTNSVDETNECIKTLGREIQEELLVTEGTQERRNLKFLKQRIDGLSPMNANGFFIIDKTTLTSMLSVR